MKPDRPCKSKGSPYPPEFREDAVRYWLSIGQSLKAVATDLGLAPETLRSWRQQLETSVKPAAPGAGTDSLASSASELALAREIGQLRRELEAMMRCSATLKCFTIASGCIPHWAINRPSSLSKTTCNKIYKRSKTFCFPCPPNQGKISQFLCITRRMILHHTFGESLVSDACWRLCSSPSKPLRTNRFRCLFKTSAKRV